MLQPANIPKLIFAVAVLFIPACKSINTTKSLSPKPKIPYPESVIKKLDANALQEYKKLLLNAPAPKKNPYTANARSKLYIQWYQRGYAYGWQQKQHILRSQAWEKDDKRRVVLNGWYSGNSRASLEFENKKIQDSTEILLQKSLEKIEPDRNRCIKVVNEIEKEKIVIPKSGIIKLPVPYTDLSLDGIVYANKNTSRTAVAFKTWQGKGKNMRGFIHLSAPLQPQEIKTNYYGEAVLRVGPIDLTLENKINDKCYKAVYGLD
jgi:hypothetical protein